jgi:hypothetical protein
MDHPPAGDLRKMMKEQPLPVIPQDVLELAAKHSADTAAHAEAVLETLSIALAIGLAEIVEDCFYKPQAYWKDMLALTWHFRTFTSAGVITAALLEMKNLRGLEGNIKIDGDVRFSPANPTLVRPEPSMTEVA